MIEGYPIFDRIPDFANDPVSDANSLVSKETTGLRDYIRWDARPLIKISQNHTFDSTEPVEDVLQQFITNMGAAGTFWVPTWQPDFSMVTGISTGLNQLVINPVAYEDSYLTGTSVTEPGHYLAIYNENTGTLWTPKVLSVSVDGETGYETLTLSETAPEDLFVDSTIVSLLILSRHLEDTLEISYESPEIASVNLEFIQTRTFNASPITSTYEDETLLNLNRQLKTNGEIKGMVNDGSKMYLIGLFTSADVIEYDGNNWNTTETNAIPYAASFDMDTGVWDSWNPSLHTTNPEYILVEDKVYISNLTTPFLKAYDKVTGVQDGSFNPDVRAINGKPSIFKTGGKIILCGINEEDLEDGTVTVYNPVDLESERAFHILDPTTGEPLRDFFYDLPSDAKVWVLGVHNGYIYFASLSYSYTNGLYTFPDLLIDIKPKGIYRMSVDGKIDTSFKSDDTTTDLRGGYWGIKSFADSENNSLIVYGTKGNLNLGVFIIDLDIGYDKFTTPVVDIQPSLGGIPSIKQIYPTGNNNLIVSGSLHNWGGVVRCTKSTGGFLTAFNGGYPDRSNNSLAVPNPDGSAIWIGELYSSHFTNLYKTLPSDARIIDVPDLS